MIIEGLVSCGHRYKVATPEPRRRKSEHRLMIAIIHRALEDALGAKSGENMTRDALKRNILNAQNWFTSNDHSAFSFSHCCEELGIDKKLFLKKVKKLIKEKTK